MRDIFSATGTLTGTSFSQQHSVLVSAGDVSIMTYLDGAPDGPEILLLPAAGRGTGDCGSVVELLVSRGYLVLRPEPRGVSASTGPLRRVDLGDLAYDVAHIIAALAQGPLARFGHAFGFCVASTLATNHPLSVAALILAVAPAQQLGPELDAVLSQATALTLPDDQRLAPPRRCRSSDPGRGRRSGPDPRAPSSWRHIDWSTSNFTRGSTRGGSTIPARYTDMRPGGPEPGIWRLPAAALHRLPEERTLEWRDNIDAPEDVTLAGGASGSPRPVPLISEQAALRRVAALVAGGASQTEVFDAIVAEAAELFGTETWLVRYDADGSAFFLASAGARSDREPRRFTPTGDGTFAEVLRSRRPACVDGYANSVGPGPDLAPQHGVPATAAVPLILQGNVWGALALVTHSAPLAVGIEDRLAQFAGLAASAIDNSQSRADLQLLADEQAALRRVAELVAGGAPTHKVFAQVTLEAAQLLNDTAAVLMRYEPSGAAAEIVAQSSDRDGEAYWPAGTAATGTRVPVVGDIGLAQVWRTRRVARVDDLRGVIGADAIPVLVDGAAVVMAPILVEDRLWGVLDVRGPRGALPVGTEDRLARFAELAGTAIANTQSRADLQLLADEQAALRRLAVLVARGAGTQSVFDAVTLEAHRLLDGSPTALWRVEPSGDMVIVAQVGDARPTGARLAAVIDDPGLGRVIRDRRPVRIDDLSGVLPPGGFPIQVSGGVGVPIVTAGRMWGTLVTYSTGEPLASRTEDRLARFAELVASAITDAESRAELMTSRSRIVANADEARLRLARDVHDGAQQRLVHALITLKRARAALSDGDGAAAELLDESLAQAQSANEQLRELAQGILPAALARGGLRAGVKSLLEHISLPVHTHLLAERLPEPVETTAYFIIAEALTNVVKHAGAEQAHVRAIAVGDQLRLEVTDTGRGGANPVGGSGLTGLADRVHAAGGSMLLTSPPDAGTRLSITLPIPAVGDSATAMPHGQDGWAIPKTTSAMASSSPAT